jgi:cytochrome c
MISSCWKAVAGAMLCFAIAGGAHADDDEAEYGALVDRPGVETTHAWCTACHSEMIVAQQGMSRHRWEQTLEWMVEEQGMPELDEEELDEILTYLAENYGEDRPNFPSNN